MFGRDAEGCDKVVSASDDLGRERGVLARAEVALWDQTSLLPTHGLLLQSHAQTSWEACSSPVKQINTGGHTGQDFSQKGQQGSVLKQHRLTVALHQAVHWLPYHFQPLAKAIDDLTTATTFLCTSEETNKSYTCWFKATKYDPKKVHAAPIKYNGPPPNHKPRQNFKTRPLRHDVFSIVCSVSEPCQTVKLICVTSPTVSAVCPKSCLAQTSSFAVFLQKIEMSSVPLKS